MVEEDEDEGQEEQAHWVEASHVGPRYDCTTLELHGLEPLCLVGRLKLRFSSSFEAWHVRRGHFLKMGSLRCCLRCCLGLPAAWQ